MSEIQSGGDAFMQRAEMPPRGRRDMTDQRVSDETVATLAEQGKRQLGRYLRYDLALDLLDARQRIAELEARVTLLLQTDTAQESFGGECVLNDEEGIQGCAFCEADYMGYDVPLGWKHQSDCPLKALANSVLKERPEEP